MKVFNFYKEENNKWYVDLPNWFGEKDDLEMVMGADQMLDIMAEGENVKRLLISKSDNTYSNYTLKRQEEEHDGCWYEIHGMNITPFKLWLCSVTKFALGGYPKEIYIRS